MRYVFNVTLERVNCVGETEFLNFLSYVLYGMFLLVFHSLRLIACRLCFTS
jgi:hypothetical protein